MQRTVRHERSVKMDKLFYLLFVIWVPGVIGVFTKVGSLNFVRVKNFKVLAGEWSVVEKFSYLDLTRHSDRLAGEVKVLWDRVERIIELESLNDTNLGHMVTENKHRVADITMRVNALRSHAFSLETAIQMYDGNAEFRRVKRGLFNFLGDMIGAVTGLSTSSELQTLTEKISKIRGSQQSILHILDKSVSVLNSTSLLARGNTRKLNQILENQGVLRKNLVALGAQSDTLDKKIFIEKITNYFLLGLSNFELHISLIEEEFWKRTSIIQQTLVNKLSLTWIDPDSLRSILHRISKQVPRDLKLPVSGDLNVLAYYKYVKTDIFVKNKSAFIVAFLPLVEFSNFELYKTLSFDLPSVISSNHTTKIEIKSEYLGVDLTRGLFFEFNSVEASSCLKSEYDFCEVRKAFQTINRRVNRCEINCLIFGVECLENCEITLSVIDTSISYAVFYHNNIWAIISRGVTFTVTCPQRTFVVIMKFGLDFLELGHNCKAIAEGLIINSFRGGNSTVIEQPEFVSIDTNVREMMTIFNKSVKNWDIGFKELNKLSVVGQKVNLESLRT